MPTKTLRRACYARHKVANLRIGGILFIFLLYFSISIEKDE